MYNFRFFYSKNQKIAIMYLRLFRNGPSPNFGEGGNNLMNKLENKFTDETSLTEITAAFAIVTFYKSKGNRFAENCIEI